MAETQFLAKFVPQSSLVSCAFLLFTTVMLWDDPVYQISKTSSRRAQRKNFEYRFLHTVPDVRATLKLSRDVHSKPATDIPTGICFTDHTSVPLANFFPLPDVGVIGNLSPLSEKTGFPFGRSPARKPQALHQRIASPSIRARPPLLQGAPPFRNPEHRTRRGFCKGTGSCDFRERDTSPAPSHPAAHACADCFAWVSETSRAHFSK